MILSIVVIEYNSLADIILFTKEVKRKIQGVEYELIVSSNSLYKPLQQEAIQKQYPDIRWSFNERNGGFAYGMNRGLEKATGDFLMIANPDLILKQGLDKAIAFLGSHSEIGAIGPMIKDENGNVQDSARPYVTLSGWTRRQVKRVSRNDEQYDLSCIQTVDWVIGACILMRRDAYSKVKGLDEHYFMYAEDLDVCTRIREAGYEVVYYPPMEVEYKGTRSARHSWKYTKVFLKSHFYYWRKFGYFNISPKRKEILFESKGI